MPAKKDDKVVKDIIKRYGATLDLKSSPYLIVEIIRQYAGRIAGPAEADCLPPGGPPPKKFDPQQLVRELNERLADVSRLSQALARTMQAAPAARAPAKAGAAKEKAPKARGKDKVAKDKAPKDKAAKKSARTAS